MCDWHVYNKLLLTYLLTYFVGYWCTFMCRMLYLMHNEQCRGSDHNLYHIIHREPKIGATLFSIKTLPFHGQFLCFLRQCKHEWMLCSWVTKSTTSVTVCPRCLVLLITTWNSTFWSHLSQYFITRQHKWVCELLAMLIYKLCSKCPPFTLTHIVSRHCQWSAAMSIMRCSKFFHMNCARSNAMKCNFVTCNVTQLWCHQLIKQVNCRVFFLFSLV